MPALGSLTSPKIVTVTFTYDDETVTISYDRNKMTTNLLSRVQESNDPAVIADVFAAVIHEWDVTEDDGSPFPPSAENLGKLPLAALKLLSEAIGNSPPSEEGKDSSGPSSTQPGTFAEQARISQNGPGISSSPAPSVFPSTS